ncbi:hypothetical protein [Sedimentitalea arenosa]
MLSIVMMLIHRRAMPDGHSTHLGSTTCSPRTSVRASAAFSSGRSPTAAQTI